MCLQKNASEGRAQGDVSSAAIHSSMYWFQHKRLGCCDGIDALSHSVNGSPSFRRIVPYFAQI